jgi:hypothetical protein
MSSRLRLSWGNFGVTDPEGRGVDAIAIAAAGLRPAAATSSEHFVRLAFVSRVKG